MIYKILADFTDCLDEIIKEISNDFNIFFFNNILYVSKKDPYNQTDLKKILKLDNVCIIEITEKNLKREPEFVVDWCRDNFVKLDTIKFEKEQQTAIKEMLNFIELFDENMQKILKERSEENG